MSDEILSATKWVDLIEAIEINSPVKFPVKHKSTVRSTISNAILRDFPDRDFKTWTDNETITVYRTR